MLFRSIDKANSSAEKFNTRIFWLTIVAAGVAVVGLILTGVQTNIALSEHAASESQRKTEQLAKQVADATNQTLVHTIEQQQSALRSQKVIENQMDHQTKILNDIDARLKRSRIR